jgi:hypothetical protein
MKDLSREEKLEQEILKMADECEDKKWMRVKRTFFILSAVIYLMELYFVLKGGISEISIEAICGLLFAPLFGAGFIMFISSMVLLYITTGSMNDEKAIAKKMGELNAIKFSKYE